MKIPTTLKHKPVVVSEDYDRIDGRYANDSDAKGLSLGLAQWNDRGKVDISAKVWRYTGSKWFRQSEEMPLRWIWRFLSAVVNSISRRYPKLYDEAKPMIERMPMQGDAMNLAVATDNEYIDEDIKLFSQALSNDDEMLSERLARLGGVLREMGF